MMRLPTAILALLIACLCAFPASAQDEASPTVLAGTARVVDGDTLELQADGGTGARIRLFGVNAAELDDFPNGPIARATLLRIVGDSALTCEVRGESYGRIVALCRLPDGTDIGEALIRAGHGLSARTFLRGTDEGDVYEAAEVDAIDAGRGLWREHVEPDWWESEWGFWLKLFISAAVPFATIFLAVRWGYRNARRLYEDAQKDHRDRITAAVLAELWVNLETLLRWYRETFRVISKDLNTKGMYNKFLLLQTGPIPATSIYDGSGGEIGRLDPKLAGAIIALTGIVRYEPRAIERRVQELNASKHVTIDELVNVFVDGSQLMDKVTTRGEVLLVGLERADADSREIEGWKKLLADWRNERVHLSHFIAAVRVPKFSDQIPPEWKDS